jgi:hypothetical protein
MSIPTQLDYIRCIAQSHWKIPAFGYINNQDHRLVEPGQIFDERDTSDRGDYLSAARPGQLQRAPKLRKFGCASTNLVSPRRTASWKCVRSGPTPTTS